MIAREMIKWIWILLVLSPMALAQSPLQLIDSDEVLRLSRHAKILYETDAPLTLEQVRAQPDAFEWVVNDNPNYGIHDQGVWLHVTFSNVTNTRQWVIDVVFSQLEQIDFYLLNQGEMLAQSRQGKLRPGQPIRIPTINVDLPYATPLDLYIRVQSEGSSLIVPIDIQTREIHERLMFYDSLLWGLFYGGLFILAVYNLVLYLGSKEPSLLAYVGYISTVILWQFVWGGHLGMLFPSAATVWLGQHMDLIFVVIGIGSGVFTYAFLEAPVNAPKSTLFIRLSMLSLAVMGLCSLFSLLPPLWQNSMVYTFSILAIMCYLVAGFEAYLNHFQPARYFIFAWSILASCALIGMFSLIGLFPSNFFTTYCFQFGVFLEAGLFSLALMDKSRNRLELEVTQATNDLRNNMEFIEEQNVRLDIARKDAIKASHVKSQFLANMSHEIRTPLNAILGFSKELNQLQLPPERQEQVRIINAAADNLLNIVNDVLDVSKIEAGKLQINNQPFSPNQVLEEIVSLMAKSAHQKKLEFVFDLAPLPDKLIGDATRIKQVLNNLLSNALKFTPKGHVALKASGKELEHGLYELRLNVEDTGIGISQQDRKKLFNAFSQVDDALSRSYQGTGLGLVICQQLVKLMRGKITLSSSPGKGSSFAVTLRTTLLNSNVSLFNHPQWRGKEVLLHDPNVRSANTTKALLNTMGCNVIFAESTAGLAAQHAVFDAAFITLPQSHQAMRADVLAACQHLKSQQLVFLYSGEAPSNLTQNRQPSTTTRMPLPLTPVKLESLNSSTAASFQDRQQRQLSSLPRARILAVDDMEMNLRLLRTWLKPSKLELTLAYSGEDAVKLCHEQEFDLILMDVQMPHMDGLQATQLIRKTELNIGTPIIAVTAHAFKEEQENLLQSGMDDYLPKPLDLNDLVKLIGRWCDEEQQEQATRPSLDWHQAMARANQNADAALEVLQAFVHQLPGLEAEMDSHWQARDYPALQQTVHKLHGACCYTGVPALQQLCGEVEGQLKRDYFKRVDEAMPNLLQECRRVTEDSKALFNDLAAASPGFGTA